MAKNNDDSGFWQSLFGGIADAIADVRNKVVDEGWFGRHQTNDFGTKSPSEYRSIMPETEASFEEGWMASALSEREDIETADRKTYSNTIDH